MKPWKVILATLVIFVCGLVTGAVMTRKLAPVRSSGSMGQMFQGPEWVQQRFLERMRTELDLKPEQAEHMRHIFAESRERIKILWEVIGPEVQEELKEVREKIDSELTAAQQKKFDRLLRESRPAREGNRGRFPREAASGDANPRGGAGSQGSGPRRPPAERGTNTPPLRERP